MITKAEEASYSVVNAQRKNVITHFVIIFVGISVIGSFYYRITKPFPIFWPLTFNIFYRGAWGEVFNKSKLA